MAVFLRFAYKHILQEHQNLHYGLKPHACLSCEKKFAARSNLIQHSRRHRPGNNGFQECSSNEQAEKASKKRKNDTFVREITFDRDLCPKK